MLWTIDTYGIRDGTWDNPETGFGTVGMLCHLSGTIVGLAVHDEALTR